MRLDRGELDRLAGRVVAAPGPSSLRSISETVPERAGGGDHDGMAPKPKKKKKAKKQSLAEGLGDVSEQVLDL